MHGPIMPDPSRRRTIRLDLADELMVTDPARDRFGAQILNEQNARSILEHAPSTEPATNQRSVLRGEPRAGNRSCHLATGRYYGLPAAAPRGAVRGLRRPLRQPSDGLRPSRSQRKELHALLRASRPQEPGPNPGRGSEVRRRLCELPPTAFEGAPSGVARVPNALSVTTDRGAPGTMAISRRRPRPASVGAVCRLPGPVRALLHGLRPRRSLNQDR